MLGDSRAALFFKLRTCYFGALACLGGLVGLEVGRLILLPGTTVGALIGVAVGRLALLPGTTGETVVLVLQLAGRLDDKAQIC